MTQKNTPNNSSQKKEKSKNADHFTAQSLYDQALRDIIGVSEGQSKRNFEIDPEKYNLVKNKQIKLSDTIKERVVYLRNESDDYSHISDDDITQFDTTHIDYTFHAYCRPLIVIREKLDRKIRSAFPHLSQEDVKILRGKISQARITAISELLHRKKDLQQYIESNLGLNPGSIVENIDDIESIFPDLHTLNYAVFVEIRDHLSVAGNLESLPRMLLMKAFRTYESRPHILRNIAEKFDLTLSLKECLRYQLIDNATLESLAKSYVGEDVWNRFREDQKKQYMLELKYDDTLVISSDQIANIESLMQTNKNIQSIFQSSFQRELDFLGEHGNDPILGDLDPDIVNQGTDKEKWIWHRVWLKKIQKLLLQKGVHIDGSEKIGAGSVISFPDPHDKQIVHTIRIDQQDVSINSIENGISYTILTASDGVVWTGSSETQTVSYTEFGSMVLHMQNARVYTAQEFQDTIVTDPAKKTLNTSLLTASGSDKVLDQGATFNALTKEKFLEEIDTIHDPKGKGIPLEVGMSFISHSGEDSFIDKEFAYTIVSIDESGIQVEGVDFRLTFSQFLEVIQRQGFRRIGKVSTDSDFVSALSAFGVDSHTVIKDGFITLEASNHEHDDHGAHDTHGYHAEEGPTQYNYFTSKSGGHIKIFEIKDGYVQFGQWKGIVDLDKAQKANSAGKVSKKEIKNLYSFNAPMSYAQFIDYLKQNEFTASKKDLLIDPDASYHEAHFHMDDTPLKRWMKNPSLADIFHGISGVVHAAEHYFEKGSKLNGSRSALWLAKKFGLPQDILAQLQADEIGNMKGIIDKIKDKLKGLNGPKARIKALHIAHMKGSRPEEIAAAALYMVEGYGQLYAEDIAHAEGTESFLNALIYACGYTTPAAIREQKVKARVKFRSDIGNEGGEQITEMEMIWGFLKGMDGNAEENPLAGALVKAMGGPSYWEKCIRADGLKGAVDKGKRQTADIPNAQGRMNKYLSALATHEIGTAAGMMYNIPGKDVSPEMQGAPIIWALCGITQYAGTKLVQDNLWPFVSSQGHSFHAYSFLRNKPVNDLYRDVFLKAMEGIADPADIQSIRHSIQSVQLDGHRDPNDTDLSKKQLRHFQNINNIWRKYCNKGLHARLQGHDPWIIDQIHTHHNSTVENYFSYMGGLTHSMMSDVNAPTSDCGWEQQFGYSQSMIVKKTDDNLFSLGWQINKISTAGSNNFALHEMKFARYWGPIKNAFSTLRYSSISEELKKKQYLQYRKDVIEHFRRLLNSYGLRNRDQALNGVRSQPYSKDLLQMGITLEEIFTEEYSTQDGVAMNDYESWLDGGRILSTQQETITVQKKTQDLLVQMKDTNTGARNKMKEITQNTPHGIDREDFAEL